MSIDVAIVVVLLFITFAIGIYKGRSINNIQEYAIGNRDFSTTALVCTIVASWIGGDDFFVFVSETYENGLYFIWTFPLGIVTVLILTGTVFVPRMSEFLGTLSIAEAMGNLYGQNVRIISAIAGCLSMVGFIAAQFKIAGQLFEYAFGISGVYGIIVGGSIVTIYAAFGGIKSVTFTDVIQFFMFGTVVPTLALFLFGTLGSTEQIWTVVNSNPTFDVSQVFDFSQLKSFYYLFLFFYIIIPGFDPTLFQRISMSKDVFQGRKAFVVSGLIYFPLCFLMCWIGVISLSLYPNIDPNDVAKHIISDYSYIGLKGITIAGILAMVMSTADSYTNSTSILFIHDLCKPLGIKVKNELAASRLFSLILGVAGIILAIYSTNLLKLIITSRSFYMPIVSLPFIFAILGFRPSTKSVLIGMASGFITVVFWELFMRNDFIDSVIPGMLANTMFLFGSHYLFTKKGGWVGIKDYTPVIEIKRHRKQLITNFIESIKNFSFLEICKKDAPKNESMYMHFGLFCIISTYFGLHTLPEGTQELHKDIISFIYPSVFFLSTMIISYPIWTSFLKKTNLIHYLWIFAIFYILIGVGFTQLLISHFYKFQLMTFIVNFVVVATLIRWQLTLIMMIVGTFISIQIFKVYTGMEVFTNGLSNFQFTVAYVLLLTSTTLVIFSKPKQDHLQATEEDNYILKSKTHDFEEKIKIQDKEIARLSAAAQRILNNVNHELRLPVGNVMNFAEMLGDGLEKFNEKQLKMISEEVVKNSTRLSSMILNMLDLAMLESKKIELDLRTINISDMVAERAKYCYKMYSDGKKLDFGYDLEPEILAKVDVNYMRQVVDNLIVNAIKYTPEGGKVEIFLRSKDRELLLEVKDNGMGIPEKELKEIFGTFIVSSKNWSQADGRGVGLALCKKAIDAHGGKITVESDGTKGAHFKVWLSGIMKAAQPI